MPQAPVPVPPVAVAPVPPVAVPQAPVPVPPVAVAPVSPVAVPQATVPVPPVAVAPVSLVVPQLYGQQIRGKCVEYKPVFGEKIICWLLLYCPSCKIS